MGLDGRLGHRKLIGDLLVEQTLGQHRQHARLLRGERGESPHALGGLAINGSVEIDIRRRPDLAGQHRADRGLHRLHVGALGDEARGAEFEAQANDVALLARGHDHYRRAGILGAQHDQAGIAARAGHREIEQDEIDVRIGVERLRRLVEAAAFDDIRPGDGVGDCLAQGATEKRMIVGDQNAGRLMFQSRLFALGPNRLLKAEAGGSGRKQSLYRTFFYHILKSNRRKQIVFPAPDAAPSCAPFALRRKPRRGRGRGPLRPSLQRAKKRRK